MVTSPSFVAWASVSLCATVALVLLAGAPLEPPRADVGDGLLTSVAIGRNRLSCDTRTGPAFVRYEPDDHLEIAYTDDTMVGTPQIVLGRRFLSFPPAARAFIFFHECGHVVLGHVDAWDTVGRTDAQGLEADCFAAFQATRRGYPADEMLVGLRPIVWPARLAAIERCVG